MEISGKIDGVSIQDPSGFHTSYYNLTKSGRVANGDMTMEIVSQKRKFTLTYDVIDSIQLGVIMQQIFFARNPFMTFTFVDDGSNQSATVYVGEIPKDLYRTGAKNYYKDFTFDLIEQ